MRVQNNKKPAFKPVQNNKKPAIKPSKKKAAVKPSCAKPSSTTTPQEILELNEMRDVGLISPKEWSKRSLEVKSV